MMAEDQYSNIFKKKSPFPGELTSNKYIDDFKKRNIGIHMALRELEEYHDKINTEELAEAYLITILNVEGFKKSDDLRQHFNMLAVVNMNSTPRLPYIHETQQRISDAIKLAGEIEVSLD